MVSDKDQTKILRNFSGAKRLEIAVELSAMVQELAMAGLKRQHPKASKKEIMNLWVKETSLPY